MIVFRLANLKYVNDLSGKGAEKSGGRWNSRGTSMLYTSISRALCTAEIAVHTPLGIVPRDYTLATIEIPDLARLLKTELNKLPDDWESFPLPNSTQLLGDRFIAENKYLVMQVPSVVVQGEFNYLLNPLHKDFGRIKLIRTEPFVFDKRLFTR
jgi:RES domain-containing protein